MNYPNYDKPSALPPVDLEMRVSELAAEVAAMRSTMDQCREILSQAQAEIAPLIDRMSNHTMFKMLFGSK